MDESFAIQNLLAQTASNPWAAALYGGFIKFFSSNLGVLKIISIFLTAFFLAFAVYSAIVTGWLALRVDRFQDVVLKTNLPKKRSLKAWRQIQRHYLSGDENDLKIALIQADNLLDEALRLGGFPGENLGERLKHITEAQLPEVERIWEAHKLRNRLVHETDFRLDRDLAERALTIYRKAFQELGLLDE